MYSMKNIINYNEEVVLPKCMYFIKNPNESLKSDIDDLNISNQIPKSKMAELEERQEQLLKKLDILHDRIKTISSYCNPNSSSNIQIKKENNAVTATVPPLHEAVLTVNPDSLPWYLNHIIKSSNADVSLSSHIHSSVPNEKVPKIKAFLKTIKDGSQSGNPINLRLIFKSVSADSELKLNSLSLPIVGTVNILRYLSFAYPNIISYDCNDYNVDSLLDICHIIEKSSDKNREPLLKKLFAKSKDWIYNNQFSIIDLAAINVVKQSKSNVKLVPKPWFDKCDKVSS